MIPSREIADTANEWQLAHNVVEKDYVLGWLLAGIAQHPVTNSWAFKGGTCLRKCWFETYRFSEDLDFTVSEADLDVSVLDDAFGGIAEWVLSRCGLRLVLDGKSFREKRNKRGNPTIEGRVAYIGPLGMPTPPKVKLDLTADEVVVRQLGRQPVFHPFSDVGSGGAVDHVADVLCYALPELLGEKLRALAERCRPRDLYDVVHIHRHPDLIGRAGDVAQILETKCAHIGINPPTLETILNSPFRDEIEAEWSNMLGHQLPFLPPFEEFWSQLESVFSWLGGARPVAQLPELSPTEPVADCGRSSHHNLAHRITDGAHPLRRRQSPEGDHRLRGEGRPERTTNRRAVFAPPFEELESVALRGQRPWPTACLSGRPHPRGQRRTGDVRSSLPSGVLIECRRHRSGPPRHRGPLTCGEMPAGRPRRGRPPE